MTPNELKTLDFGKKEVTKGYPRFCEDPGIDHIFDHNHPTRIKTTAF